MRVFGESVRYTVFQKEEKACMFLYHSTDLSHNVTLLSDPFPQLGGKLWAGITSYPSLSPSAV